MQPHASATRQGKARQGKATCKDQGSALLDDPFALGPLSVTRIDLQQI